MKPALIMSDNKMTNFQNISISIHKGFHIARMRDSEKNQQFICDQWKLDFKLNT